MKHSTKILATMLLLAVTATTMASQTFISTAGDTTLVIDPTTSKVYAAGNCEQGNCGLAGLGRVNITPTYTGMYNIKSVTTSSHQAVFLTKNGNVYTAGNTTKAYKGRGAQPTPVKLEFPNKVIDVSTNFWKNGFHFIVREGNYIGIDGNVHEMGSIWKWDGHPSSAPVQISTAANFMMLSGGFYNTAALDQFGNLYSWGTSYKYYGDGGMSTAAVDRPGDIPTIEGMKFRFISIGNDHFTAVDTDNVAWGWGNGKSGKLCQGNESGSLTPIRLAGMENASQISAKGNNTMSVSNDGEFRVCGWHNLIGVGTGYNRDYNTSTLKWDGPAVAMNDNGMNDWNMFLGTDNKVYGWGGNRNGQLGINNNIEQHKPTVFGAFKSTPDADAFEIVGDDKWEPIVTADRNRGHGNDVGGIDYDNPGKSTGVNENSRIVRGHKAQALTRSVINLNSNDPAKRQAAKDYIASFKSKK